MWRLWTRGFGVRDWWHWFRVTGFPVWVAFHLPPRWVYWCAIRVATHEPASLSLEEFATWEAVPDRRSCNRWRLCY